MCGWCNNLILIRKKKKTKINLKENPQDIFLFYGWLVSDSLKKKKFILNSSILLVQI